MRNEELEQRLQISYEKSWALKQITIEQQNLLQANAFERKIYHEEIRRVYAEQKSNLSFTDFECNRLIDVIKNSEVFEDSA